MITKKNSDGLGVQRSVAQRVPCYRTNVRLGALFFPAVAERQVVDYVLLLAVAGVQWAMEQLLMKNEDVGRMQ